MSQIAIITDLEQWEKSLIEVTQKLFPYVTELSDKSFDLPIYNLVTSKKKRGSDGYDSRLNLAYCLYITKQVCTVTKTFRFSNSDIKSISEKFGIYCPNTDIATGLYLAGYNVKPTSSFYYWDVNLTSKCKSKKYNLSKHDDFRSKIRQAITDSNPGCVIEFKRFKVESIARVENNQIITNEVDFKSIYENHYSA